MLSYQWDNQTLVEKVYNALRSQGLKAWMDIKGGVSGNINDRYGQFYVFLKRHWGCKERLQLDSRGRGCPGDVTLALYKKYASSKWHPSTQDGNKTY